MFTLTCPTCRRRLAVERAEDARYRPFCCRRCQWIDLGKWLDEEYRISDSASGADGSDRPDAGHPSIDPDDSPA